MKRLLVLVLLIAACTPATSGGTVVLSEFALSLPGSVAAGLVTLDVTNRGEFGHTVLVTDESGAVVGSTDVIGSGDGATLQLELPPGNYQVSCRIVVETPDGEIVDHYERGMFASLTVRE